MKKVTLLLLLFSLCKVGSAQVFVNQKATGKNDGTSWQNAFTDLDVAIRATSSGEIWVAAGLYLPSTDLNGKVPADNRQKTFRLKEKVALYGGFKGNETTRSQRDWKTNLTILSGDIGRKGDITDNTIHVVSAEYARLDSSTILDGFTIRDGYSYSQDSGAGIYINYTTGGQFIIRNCLIENNNSSRYGGGLYIFNSDPQHNFLE